MADYNNTGSFRLVAGDSELLHRPVQSFAVQGQAAFLALCVDLQVPVLSGAQNAESLWDLAPSGSGTSAFVSGHTGEGWTLDSGGSCVNTFSSAWFDKFRSGRDGSSGLKVRHVCKRIQVGGRASDDRSDARHLASIANEVRILANRSVRSSANIVALIAVSWCEAPDPQSDRFWPQLLLEQAELGTLDACLTQNTLPKPTKFMLYRDILDGLRYLHANGIVHGDLKPQNILLSHHASVDERYGLLPLKAKLCDFGYSVILSDYHQSLPFRAEMGTWPWPAPELDGETSIPASLLPSTDVYSAGLLMVCIVRDGKTPFPGMSKAQVVAVKKENTYVVLDCVFRELGWSYALGAPRGLSREQMGKLCYEHAMMPTSLPRIATQEILRDLEGPAASDTTVLSAEAYFALAGCYKNGSLTDQDHATAITYLRRAAELKHPGAIGSLPGIQAALGETPSSPQSADVRLVYFQLDGYLKTAMETAMLPRSLSWKSWREPAYRAYRSSPRRLADARHVVLRAADKHILGIFLSYILQLETSPDPEHDEMAMSFRGIFRVVDINGPADEGYTILQHAVLAGNLNAVNSAITLGVGVDVDAVGHTPGWTPFWLSVVTGQGAIARLLLDKGASPDCRDTRTGATLVHILHQLTAQEDIDAVLQAVLQSDSAVVVTVDTLARNITPLLACFLGWDYSEGKAARALLRHGANPTFAVHFGLPPNSATSPMSLCAATLDYSLLEDMLGCPWAASHGDQPPGRKALAGARAAAYMSILSNTEFYYRSILGGRFGHALDKFLNLVVTPDMMKYLREMVLGPAGGETETCVAGPMASALWMSRAYVARALLRLFPCDHFPPSPLQRPLIQIAIERRMRATIMDLLERGADLLALEPRGYTALHAAAHYYPDMLLELILQAKDSRGLDVRPLLLFEGYRAEQRIMEELQTRFDLDMDSYDMPNGMTLAGMCVGLIMASGSVPISQLEYLLEMSPKPKFECSASGTVTLLGFAISGKQGNSRTAPTVTRRLVTLILDGYYPNMSNFLTEDHGSHFYRAVRSGNMVALELMEERLRRVTPAVIGTSRFLHAMLSAAAAERNRGPVAGIRPRAYFEALEMFQMVYEKFVPDAVL
ncbi:hypothetical protein C8A05DRAFT_36674 [Staphylotrichum tortipilum]|uniref:Protein kinase domain-containing protein n=1 Tax=Staphylotrichum tortipilum TaxID=2831512 RepID=A0AAN6MGI9_9PEZI|nr:hypothetical protein C8A05DRAFT_36674 [Staphylotrichum longicolle]